MKVSYEDYLKQNLTIVYMLRGLWLHGDFTLNEDNEIPFSQSNSKEKKRHRIFELISLTGLLR